MEKEYNIWFSKLKLSNNAKLKLLNHFVTPKNIWNLTEKDLKCISLENEKISEILSVKNRINLENELKYIENNSIYIYNCNENNYPEKLKNIKDRPAVIYIKGNTKLLSEEMIAMVGSRNASEYGKKVAISIARELSNNNIGIVSGLANGIDKYSHIGALLGKCKKTVAVLGNGIRDNKIYPKENIKLYEEILKNDGCVISEYSIDSNAERWHFPARNRIISGISDKIIVVEAGLNSGSFITVDFALEQGKDVYAVPGGIYSKQSAGCNKLIKEGAEPILSVKDVLNF